MEFLKREGLYSPQVKDMRTDDPVATDLIGALLTVIQINNNNNSWHNEIYNTIDQCQQKWTVYKYFLYSKGHQIRYHLDEAQTIQWFGQQIVKVPFCH